MEPKNPSIKFLQEKKLRSFNKKDDFTLVSGKDRDIFKNLFKNLKSNYLDERAFENPSNGLEGVEIHIFALGNITKCPLKKLRGDYFL